MDNNELSTNLASLGTDFISRQQAIDIAKDLTITVEGYEMHNQAVMNYCADIMQLPPIQPKRGKWIKISPANIYECSECGKNVMTNDICAYDFCHGCGADMRGEQNG